MISVVITTHGEAKELPGMLHSLKNQREYHATPKVMWVAGEPFEYPLDVIVTCDGPLEMLIPRTLPYRLIENDIEGGVGHHTREPGIKRANGDYIVLTNSDNYFVSGWLHRLVQYITPTAGMMYWNTVNNLWQWSNQGGTQLLRGYADLSCAAVKSSVAKEIGFPFRNYDGDWDYLHACAKRCKKLGLDVVHIKNSLSVHN